MTNFYSLESHPFEYLARVPWPLGGTPQQDWIAQQAHMSQWLTHQIGPHGQAWAWAPGTGCAVTFRQAPACTLFLLRWSSPLDQ